MRGSASSLLLEHGKYEWMRRTKFCAALLESTMDGDLNSGLSASQLLWSILQGAVPALAAGWSSGGKREFTLEALDERYRGTSQTLLCNKYREGAKESPP